MARSLINKTPEQPNRGPVEIVITRATPAPTQGQVIAQPGQSIYDLCLQTYGTLDLLYQLVKDNGVPTLNYPIVVGKTFLFDKRKIKNTAIFANNRREGITYATLFSPPDGVGGADIELREDNTLELREDGTLEIRE